MPVNRVTRGFWWSARRGARLFMGTALLATVGHGVVLADPVATGSLTFTIGPNSTYTGTETFDDATFHVFGTPIDLGTAVGSAGFVGSYVLTSGTAGTGQNHAEASDPAVLHYDAAGAFICDASGCTSGAPGFFVLTLDNLGGTALAGLPPGLTYTFDGQSMDTDANLDFSGTFTINAYRSSATPMSPAGCSGAGCAVTTSTSGTFAAPSGAVVPILLDITFADVSAAGATTAVGLANVAAAPPSNIVLDAPGFPAIFFDVSTTAAVSPPVTVCFHYADADDDGIVDGSTVPATALRLLHRSSASGAFVDETVLPVDTTDEEVCARTSGLSPFAVGVSAGCGNGLVENGEECDDGAGNGRPGACCSTACATVTCSGCADVPRTDCKTPTVSPGVAARDRHRDADHARPADVEVDEGAGHDARRVRESDRDRRLFPVRVRRLRSGGLRALPGDHPGGGYVRSQGVLEGQQHRLQVHRPVRHGRRDQEGEPQSGIGREGGRLGQGEGRESPRRRSSHPAGAASDRAAPARRAMLGRDLLERAAQHRDEVQGAVRLIGARSDASEVQPGCASPGPGARSAWAARARRTGGCRRPCRSPA